ncbi:hypothetical protein DFJ58DRAFT_758309 [Suillus subalutaceus]|uniref:uncharacterized protein n=1 Tax=Suillus subalutaceus TaxID=48586 RepID=UPI001B883180|nr:uncharacterized protein DFJ58DRAFT_758309 [Suillus subalutaceus]KAG1874698.1 hypothetical protein DFJ58DRAFT_758309 [Suillus subalutaceus]
MNSASDYDAYRNELGPGVIGYIFTLWMSGLTVGQLTFYLKAFVNDHRCIKMVVIFVFVLDMFHTWCISALLWQLVINCRHNTSPQCVILPWEMLTGIFLNSMISVIVQCFYAYRVWIISDKNWKLTGSVLVIALGQYGIGIATIVTTAQSRSAAAFFTSPLEVPYAAASVICDVMISGSFLFYLRPGRAGVKRPSNHMQHLIVVSLQMGVFTSLVAIVWLLLYCIEGARYWIGFPSVILCKSNVNSMFTVLNARKSMRNQLKEHVPVVPTIPMIVVSEP